MLNNNTISSNDEIVTVLSSDLSSDEAINIVDQAYLKNAVTFDHYL